jgi:dTDP-4-dehydrorhamnose reductase/SAM-dependent methyltransferase
MKVFIFGKNGMLGNTLFLYLSQQYKVVGFDRKDFDVLSQNWSELHTLLVKNDFQPNDIVINCIGIIPQKKISSEIESSVVNTRFPHELAKVLHELNGIFIHISTNCVFPHSENAYSEEDTPNPDDTYGTTKYAGEPQGATIIRSSIIGEEKNTSYSLLSWALSANGLIKGFEDHLWNGVTCLQLAKVIYYMIKTNTFWKGVRHIHSNEIVSKSTLLQMIFQVYKSKNSVLPFHTGQPCTKLLTSSYASIIEIPPLYQQISEQKVFFKLASIPMGNFTKQELCRFCDKPTELWFEFEGTYPLAGGFLKEDSFNDDCKIPLSISLCKECELLQCNEVISSDTLFKKGYYYFSSMIPFLVSHFKSFAEKIKELYGEEEKKTVLEIGCNDGVLLRNLEGKFFKTIGVDPSHTVKNLLEDGFTIYNDYFTKETAEKIVQEHGQVDIFLSSNSFAHIHDMKNILDGLKLVLKKDGVAILEVHNSLKILQELNFEFMYHEHMTYYTKTSFCKIFERIGMHVERIEDIDVHGGSLRVYIKNSPSISSSTENFREDSNEFYKSLTEFPKKLHIWRTKFLDLYYRLRKEDKIVFGYGASGRANMFLRFLDIEIDGMLDDAHSKVGAYLPLLHTKIESSLSIYEKEKFPDYILLISWAYKDSILQKHVNYLLQGGRFIIPLPSIECINLYKE